MRSQTKISLICCRVFLLAFSYSSLAESKEELNVATDSNCALNSLYVCLRWKDIKFDRESLRFLNRRADGIYSMEEIVECCDRLGVKTEAYVCDAAYDIIGVSRPLIAHVTITLDEHPYEHFMAVLDADKDKGVKVIDLNFSARRAIWISWTEFSKMFKKSILTFPS